MSMAGPGCETPSLNPLSFSYTPLIFDPGTNLRPGSSLPTLFFSTYVVFSFFNGGCWSAHDLCVV